MFKCPFAIELTLYSEEINEKEVVFEIEQALREKFERSFPNVRVMVGQKILMSEHGEKIWRARGGDKI